MTSPETFWVKWGAVLLSSSEVPILGHLSSKPVPSDAEHQSGRLLRMLVRVSCGFWTQMASPSRYPKP